MWLPQYNILAGGCLVKSADAKDLGNVADAYVNEWSTSIENVLKRYRNINLVVPGHGSRGQGITFTYIRFIKIRNCRNTKRGEIIFSSLSSNYI